METGTPPVEPKEAGLELTPQPRIKKLSSAIVWIAAIFAVAVLWLVGYLVSSKARRPNQDHRVASVPPPVEDLAERIQRAAEREAKLAASASSIAPRSRTEGLRVTLPARIHASLHPSSARQGAHRPGTSLGRSSMEVCVATGSLRDVVFVDGVRTPFGKAGSRYANTRADDLVVKVIRHLLRRNPSLPPERIDEVAIAATTQIGDQGLTLGRSAGILAGLPRSVPGYSIDRMCARAMTAVTSVSAGIAG